MQAFFPFFVILLVAVIFSRFFVQMRIPWVVSLILGGILVGPHGLGWFQPTETIEFLGTIGLVFLMFMAGLESKLADVRRLRKQVAITAGLVGLVPALVGAAIVLGLGYPPATAALLGIIFMSSAIAMLVPIFQSQKLVDSELARTIIASAVIIDAASLLLLAGFLQFTLAGTFSWQSLLIYPVVLGILAVFAWILPKLKWLVTRRLRGGEDIFENELQFTVLVLVGMVVFFELIGLHAIIAGFFGGMILARSLASPVLKAKLHALSYGFFIPVFFVLIGASTDVTVFYANPAALGVMAAIILGLMAAKFASGWLAGRLSGFDGRSAAFIGVAVIPQLSTALAVAFLGHGAGLLDQQLLSSIIGLTIVTSVVSPLVVNAMGVHGKLQKRYQRS